MTSNRRHPQAATSSGTSPAPRTVVGRRRRPAAAVLALTAALCLAALAATATATATATAAPASPTQTIARPPLATATASRPAAHLEVWQRPQAPAHANPTNPLAHRVWGVYEGPQDQVWGPYEQATGQAHKLLGKIALRPRTKWYGSFVPDAQIGDQVRAYIAASQHGDPDALVQMAIFRMAPWEHEACARPSTDAERASYRTWITNLAHGIANTPTLIVMQPDGPFLWCTPDRRATAHLLRWATRTLSALPRTSVYIDAGAADWCENGHGNRPERCAAILKATGVRYARGFALDSTHYMSTSANIRHGAAIAAVLRRDGYGNKHFIVDTAQNGQPMAWADVIPAAAGDLKDNARTCRFKGMRRCVTLGIPPTAQPADPRWGLPADVRQIAAHQVDGLVWFGRPWLYNQADPFVLQRGLDLARTTPWPGPLLNQ